LTQSGQIELSERGNEISNNEYQPALLLQLEDLISNFNPVWASIIPKGRSEAKNFLPQDALQCFKECGLFGKLTDELIRFWDKLALAYRNYSQIRMTEIGRAGEKLSYEYERNRTGHDPVWQSVESNLSGFDLLSIVKKMDDQKLKIEVKATTSNLNYAKIHISKNEWETALSSINYIFHLWHINDTPKLYTATLEEIRKHIPIDSGEGNWESVELPFKALI
jgi:hypothetical protein